MLYNRSLIDLVPRYYSELLESEEILRAEDYELVRLNGNLYDILLQTRVSTSTWGLDYWEELAGISTDTSKSYESRRSGVIAKFRGYGTITVSHIKSVCESYVGGTVNVIEDFSNYRVVIEFVDILGIPENVEDLREILRTLIPAHLDLSLKFKFNVYSDFESIPYFKLEQFTYQELMEEELNYLGSRNTQLSSTINSDLSTYKNDHLLGGF